jgi:hypothetical protein
MLHSIRGHLVNDVSGQPIGHIFKGQALQEDWLTSENATDT